MTFFKLILAHERQENLISSVNSYFSVWDAGVIMSPDIVVVIDSSAVPNQALMSLYNPLIRYIHAPSKSINSKIALFVHEFCPRDSDWIDLCSDEDLYFRQPALPCLPFSIQLDSCFGWITLKNPSSSSYDYLLLRDMSRAGFDFLKSDSFPLSEIDQSKLLCKFSYPEGFWSLMRGDIFLMRLELLSFLRTRLPEYSVKLDEIFVNVFQAFAPITQRPGSLRFRNTDNSKALRFTSKLKADSESKRSFASIYNLLKNDKIVDFVDCLDFLLKMVNQLLKARGSHLILDLNFIDSLLQLSISSYSEALAYDFNNRSYVFPRESIRINNSLHSLSICRVDPQSLSRLGFSSARLSSLMFKNGLCKNFFLACDNFSPFAYENATEIFTAIPNNYWSL